MRISHSCDTPRTAGPDHGEHDCQMCGGRFGHPVGWMGCGGGLQNGEVL